MPDSTLDSPNTSPSDDDFDLPTNRGLRVGDTVITRFKLIECLGRGGMGEVWRANDKTLGEDIALKLLPRLVQADDQAIEELKNETKRGRQLAHPNIVRVFNFEQDANNVAIAMELVRGQNLAKLRGQQPGTIFTVDQITAWVQQLVDALDYAHRAAGVVHRDLKPANLIIDSQTQVLKIADFGIARCLAESLLRTTLSANSRGTLCYMSPEQANGRSANPLDDLYAMGATLYELLAGSPPFYQGDVYSQILKVPPTPLAQRQADNNIPQQLVPPQWEAAIMRCLAKDRKDRPQSAGEIAQMLGLRGTATASPYTNAPTLPAGRPVAQDAASALVPPQVLPTSTFHPQPTGTTRAGVTGHVGMTGSIEISTSAPIITVTAGQPTQRTFSDLTRTASQKTMPATTPLRELAPQTPSKKALPVVAIASVLTVLALAGAAGMWWTTTHRQKPLGGAGTAASADTLPAVTRGQGALATVPFPATTTGVAPVPPVYVPAAAVALKLPPAGEDWHVPSVFFQTIAQAIEAAPPGQKIRVGNKRWNEHLKIAKMVTLIGDSADQSIIAVDGRTGSPLEIHGAKGVVIESLTFEHDGTDLMENGPTLVRVEGGEATFRKCLFNKSVGDGLSVVDKATVTAEGCRFEQNAKAGVLANSDGHVKLTVPMFVSNDVGIYATGDGAEVKSEGGEIQTHAHHGVEILSGAKVTLIGVKISHAAESGIFVHDAGSSLTASEGTSVTKCVEGINLTKGGVAVLTDCGLDENTNGFVAMNPGAITLTGGHASGNSLHGVSINADTKAGAVLISGMTLKRNSGVGLLIAGEQIKPDVAGNTFGPNGQYDVFVQNGAGGLFSNNKLHTAPDFKDITGGTPKWEASNVEAP